MRLSKVRHKITFEVCKKTGTIGLLLLGLMAGRRAAGRAGGQAGRQVDEIWLNLEILYRNKIGTYCIYIFDFLLNFLSLAYCKVCY